MTSTARRATLGEAVAAVVVVVDALAVDAPVIVADNTLRSMAGDAAAATLLGSVAACAAPTRGTAGDDDDAVVEDDDSGVLIGEFGRAVGIAAAAAVDVVADDDDDDAEATLVDGV